MMEEEADCYEEWHDMTRHDISKDYEWKHPSLSLQG
jgi:hypothetical protein